LKNDRINVGRRKSSVARINLKKGNGKIIINNSSAKDYFKRDSLVMMLNQANVFAKDSKFLYTGENISNYFLGLISVNNDSNNEAFQYLKKVQLLKDVV